MKRKTRSTRNSLAAEKVAKEETTNMSTIIQRKFKTTDEFLKEALYIIHDHILSVHFGIG